MQARKQTKRLILCAMFIALGVVLGGMLSIPAFPLGTYSLKIGFGVLPVILSAVLYGPLYGGIVGGLTDFLQAIMFPKGAYMPWFTLVGILFGLIPGLFFRKGQKPTLGRLFCAVASGQAIGSVLCNTFFMVALYGLPLMGILPLRLINQAVMIPLYTLLIYFLLPLLRKADVIPYTQEAAVLAQTDLRIKRRRRLVVRITIGILLAMLLPLIAIPPFVVADMVKGPVTYLNEAAPGNLLQKVYTPEDFGIAAKELTLHTEDGLSLWAADVSVQNPKAVIIYLSGIRQPSVTYFFSHAKWMREQGYASLLLEVRGHGRSEGGRICLGYEETADVRAAVQYIGQTYGDIPIVVQGVSMGGAVAVNAFGQIPEIDALIALSAYSSFEDVAAETMRSMGFPGWLCEIERQVFRMTLNLMFDGNAVKVSPFAQCKNIGERPALFIASAGDTEVTPDNTQRLLANAPAHCESWLREGNDHFVVKNADFLNVERDIEYCAHILAFLDRNFAA